MKDEVQVTLIATGFSGKGDDKAAFFSSEAATHVAATNIQRNNATNVAPNVQQPSAQNISSGKTTQASSYFPTANEQQPISGTVSVDEDPSIPPFLRKMRG